MVPGAGAGGISGVDAGKAAALVSVLPGADVQELPGVELPSALAGAAVPVVLPVIVPGHWHGRRQGRRQGCNGHRRGQPGHAGDGPHCAHRAHCAHRRGRGRGNAAARAVTLSTDGESSTAVGAQFTLVPGSVGSSANGGEASVVAGAQGMVAAENRLVNGLGPASGDDTIAPGVVGIAMAVVPMVETCARQPLPLSRRTAVAQMSVRIQDPTRSIVVIKGKYSVR